MPQNHTNGVECRGNMSGCSLGAVDRAMLTAGASEINAKRGESTFEISRYGCVGEGINVRQEFKNLTIALEELFHRGISPCQLFVGLVAAGVVNCPAIKSEASPVARQVYRNPLFIGETGYCYCKPVKRRDVDKSFQVAQPCCLFHFSDGIANSREC